MSQPPTWPVIASTIQAAIQTAAGGLPALWRYQSTDQPPLDYVGLSLGALTTTGIDYIAETPVPAWVALTAYAVGDRAVNDGNKSYQCTTAGTSAGSGGPTGTGSTIADGSVVWAYVSQTAGIALTLGGVREVALQLEAWSGSVVEVLAAATALSILDGIVTRLRLPAARDALAAVGVTPFDPGPTNWIPSIVATTFRGRASCDVRCRMPARALVEYANFIASISATATASGAPGSPLSVPIVAP